MRALLVLVAALVIVGCSSAPQYSFTVDSERDPAPESVKERCDLLPKEASGEAPMGNILRAYDSLIGLYGICAERDAAKANWITSQGL